MEQPKLEFVVMDVAGGSKQRVLYVNGNPSHMYSDDELRRLGIPVRHIGVDADAAK